MLQADNQNNFLWSFLILSSKSFSIPTISRWSSMHVPEHRHASVYYAHCNIKVKKKPVFIKCKQSPKAIPKRHTCTSKYCAQLHTQIYI